MKDILLPAGLALAAVPASAQLSSPYNSPFGTGYNLSSTIQTPGQLPTYVKPSYGGGYTVQTPGQLTFIKYNICVPNDEAPDLAESRLRVRVFGPDDPSEVLAWDRGETQYLYDRRWSALTSAVGLRAAAEGLTSGQARLTNDLRERVGGGACL